ncbi:MAG TPA: nitrilase-related carbon-nitrogen hydrolase, partial [Gemmatimonadaceae bacterium]|nr:nitrilase-related carbon-nitrogen hydrolase [Gemmatimonadaceae bacterium]
RRLTSKPQTGGCNSVSPRGMKPIDRAIWDAREKDPGACEAELCGPKGRAWLMRWLPSRAHDNGMFLLFSNGIGPDDDEIRTGNAMILGPYGEIVAESRALGDDTVVADLDASPLPTSSGRRWLRARRPELYGALTRPTGQEEQTRRVRFGE